MNNNYNNKFIFIGIQLIIILLCINIVTFINMNNQLTQLINQNNKIEKDDEIKVTISGDLIFKTEPQLTSAEIIYEEIGEVSNNNIYTNVIDNLTDYEKELICRIAQLEAGNQPLEGQRAVVEVILNRLIDDIQPSTVEKVLSQPNQFSTWYVRGRVGQEQINEMMFVIDEVYKNDPILSQDYVYFNSLTNPMMNNRIRLYDHWFGTQ